MSAPGILWLTRDFRLTDAAALCAASLVLMVWFYPALSGLPVPYAWAKSLLRLPSWGFYIL